MATEDQQSELQALEQVSRALEPTTWAVIETITMPGRKVYEDKRIEATRKALSEAGYSRRAYITAEEAVAEAARVFPDLVRSTHMCTDAAFAEMQMFQRGAHHGYALGLSARAVRNE